MFVYSLQTACLYTISSQGWRDPWIFMFIPLHSCRIASFLSPVQNSGGLLPEQSHSWLWNGHWTWPMQWSRSIGRERVKERVHRQENINSAEGRMKNQDQQSADAGLLSSYYSLKKAYQQFYFLFVMTCVWVLGRTRDVRYGCLFALPGGASAAQLL